MHIEGAGLNYNPCPYKTQVGLTWVKFNFYVGPSLSTVSIHMGFHS